MIKRIKWNVLYADNEDQLSDSSESSNDSAQIGTEEAKVVLERLARNDPELFRSKLKYMAKSAEHGNDELSEDESDESEELQSDVDPSEVRDFALVKNDDMKSGKDKDGLCKLHECSLCPGKRLLNDEDVESHLKSKKHIAAAKRQRRMQDNNDTLHKEAPPSASAKEGEAGAARRTDLSISMLESGKIEPTVPREQPELEATHKKKLRAKRKLKSLKKRKWERSQVQTKDTGLKNAIPNKSDNFKNEDDGSGALQASQKNIQSHVTDDDTTERAKKVEERKRKLRPKNENLETKLRKSTSQKMVRKNVREIESQSQFGQLVYLPDRS